ncbi:hypothetical protein LPBF_06445 [Flavobacterium crassostreae]|uniref:Capsule biosynthesis protein CapG n=2 Tax=Flavobacterium crassostreae TaxID=1763534 RepID=A0A1B9E412_9FLAO|nr:hypothetical protein LPBF_06445 [Flavobacterium crassostreae]
MSGSAYARFKGVIVGNNCRIITKEFGTEPWLIEIGNNVTITHGVKILTHDGSTWLFNDEKGRRFLYKKVKIGNNVFIGVNSVIMPGVIIEDKVVIAAGTIVTKSIPKGVIVGGNPVKILGLYEDYEKNVLENYVSKENMDFSLSYKNRINKVVDESSKQYITIDG